MLENPVPIWDGIFLFDLFYRPDCIRLMWIIVQVDTNILIREIIVNTANIETEIFGDICKARVVVGNVR
jgi:hypothetical protein